MSNKSKVTRNTQALNLSSTQQGYAPLGDRFKSMQKDSENVPLDDSDFYFKNYANSTLEHATLDLLYPTPGYITRWKNKKNLTGAYRTTGRGGRMRVANGHFRVTVE